MKAHNFTHYSDETFEWHPQGNSCQGAYRFSQVQMVLAAPFWLGVPANQRSQKLLYIISTFIYYIRILMDKVCSHLPTELKVKQLIM